MYPNNLPKPNYPNRPIPNQNNNRFFGGGFLGPFILGGITGGLLAPSFNQRPIYGPIPIYPVPMYPNNYNIYY